VRAWELRTPGPVAAPDRLHAVQRPDPEPGAGELLVEVLACAVCRTDLQIVEGDLEPHLLPLVPGHQVVGRVSAVGDGVPAARLGELVGLAWIAGTCGECRFCRSRRENLCAQARFTGWDRDGGYATHVTARADFAHPLPAGCDPLDAAPLLCGGVIGYRALRVAGVTAGMRVGLYGFGASATLALQVARHWGCEVYVASRSPAEQDRARASGAVWAGGYDQPPPVPLDAAVTFAPVGSVVVRALEALERGGVVAVNAIHLDEIPAFPYRTLWWERQLRSVANVTRDDVHEFLDLVPQVPVRTRYEVLPLAEASTALVRLEAGDVSGAFVLDCTLPPPPSPPPSPR
jgi:propanol-preferring alcohol dehydrogenase